MTDIKKLNDEETKAVAGGSASIVEVIVPKVVDLDEEDAKKRLENVDLSYEIVYINHDTVPNGYVVKSDPKEGTKVPRNSKVRLFVSKGFGIR